MFSFLKDLLLIIVFIFSIVGIVWIVIIELDREIERYYDYPIAIYKKW